MLLFFERLQWMIENTRRHHSIWLTTNCTCYNNNLIISRLKQIGRLEAVYHVFFYVFKVFSIDFLC